MRIYRVHHQKRGLACGDYGDFHVEPWKLVSDPSSLGSLEPLSYQLA
jgi:hypothetical protein